MYLLANFNNLYTSTQARSSKRYCRKTWVILETRSEILGHYAYSNLQLSYFFCFVHLLENVSTVIGSRFFVFLLMYSKCSHTIWANPSLQAHVIRKVLQEKQCDWKFLHWNQHMMICNKLRTLFGSNLTNFKLRIWLLLWWICRHVKLHAKCIIVSKSLNSTYRSCSFWFATLSCLLQHGECLHNMCSKHE